MRVNLLKGPLGDVETPLLAVAVFADEGARGDDFAQLDGLAGGRLSALADEEGFKAEPGKVLLVHEAGGKARRCLLVGAGKRGDLAASELRKLVATAADEANARKLGSFAFAVPGGLDAGEAVRFGATGAILGGYRYMRWQTRDLEPATVEEVTLVVDADAKALSGVVARVEAACGGVMLARDLVNGPPAEVTPRRLAAEAEAIAKESGLELTVYDEKQIVEMGMNLFGAVAKGSAEPARLIHLTYRPDGATEATPGVALVGKGITFDAGGYNIKPTGAMEDMKIDMAGAAAVLGAMSAVAAWKPGYVVHGFVPTCENLVSSTAYKPGDVYKARNGKTVEIMNTDAEGRLILADTLTFASEQPGVQRIVDLATLTGACMIALGPHTAGLMGNDDAFRDKVGAAAERAGEDVWALPLPKKLKAQLKSPIADMKNIGERWGGALTAGIFLSEFVGEATWAHLDIAGPASADKPEPSVARGGTGFGVLTLLELLDGEV